MISFRNVTKTFGAARVLDDLSLTIPDGERVALIGSNGAGKTTFFRCLLGEYVHDGAIDVFGADPRQERARVLETVGFVPQLPPPLRMPVGALLDYVVALTGADPTRITETAHALGLDLKAIRSRPFVKLSGGMKQKLMIAAALGRDLKLLVMDEPAANLDPAARKVLFDLLACRHGLTMVISSHRLDEIAALVNRVVELEKGRIVLDDRISDVGALGADFAVRLVIAAGDGPFERGARDWGLRPGPEGEWRGTVAGPDRLRFLGFVARHSGIVRAFEMKGETHASVPA